MLPPLPCEEAYGRTLLGQIDRKFFVPPHAARILAAVVAIILVIPVVQATRKITEVDASLFRTSGERNRTALGRWMPTAELAGDADRTDSPYGTDHWFPTPTFVLMCLVPFAKMPIAVAGCVWAGLKVIGFLGCMFLLIRAIGREQMAVPVGVMLMAAVFGLRPVFSEIAHANVNTYMMIWIALAWLFYMEKHDYWAGIFVGLAIVTKVTPGLLLLYFLYKREWRVCIGAAVGLVVFALVIPGFYFGFAHNIELLEEWFHVIVAPFALNGYAALEIPNQSLFGVVMRLASNAGVMKLEHMTSWLQMDEVGMTDMARPATVLGRCVRPLIGVGIVGALVWLCRTKACVSRRDPRRLLELSAILLAMLLMSERTWKHHATTLPIVFLSVWYVLTCIDWSDKFRAWFVGGLVAQFFLLVASSQGILGDRLADMMLDGGFFCWGLVLCFVQIGVLLRRLPRGDVARVRPPEPQ